MTADYAAQPPIPTQMIKQSVNAVSHFMNDLAVEGETIRLARHRSVP